jgi:hypothetical protein
MSLDTQGWALERNSLSVCHPSKTDKFTNFINIHYHLRIKSSFYQHFDSVYIIYNFPYSGFMIRHMWSTIKKKIDHSRGLVLFYTRYHGMYFLAAEWFLLFTWKIWMNCQSLTLMGQHFYTILAPVSGFFAYLYIYCEISQILKKAAPICPHELVKCGPVYRHMYVC